jgi:hypothetical protein
MVPVRKPDAILRGSYVVVRISPFVTATRMHCIARTMELVIPGRLGVHSRASQQVARMSEAKSGVGLAANPGFALRRDRADKAAMTTNVHCYRIVKVGRSVVIPAGGCTSYLPGAKL